MPASGSGNIASFNAINAGSSPVTETIIVTPHYDNGSVICDGPTQDFTITVNPTGQVDDPADQVVCNSTSTATVIFSTSNTGGTTTYTWTNDRHKHRLGASGSGNIPFFKAINAGTCAGNGNNHGNPAFYKWFFYL